MKKCPVCSGTLERVTVMFQGNEVRAHCTACGAQGPTLFLEGKETFAQIRRAVIGVLVDPDILHEM